MSYHYHLEWYLPKRLLWWDYQGDLNAEGAVAIAQALISQLDGAESSVHVIADYRQLSKISFRLGMGLKSEDAARYYSHPHLGWTLYLGPEENNPFFQMVTAILAQNAKARIRWFTREADLSAFLGHHLGFSEAEVQEVAALLAKTVAV